MIDQSTIDRILEAAHIEEVISDFVKLTKRGSSYKGLCPFHDDTTPSFSVSPAKGIFKCFACGKAGNVVHFIMEHEQINYYEALKWLAKKYGIEVKEKELTPKEKEKQSARESLFIVNNYARDYFTDTLNNSNEGKNIGLAYFKERQIRPEIIKKFQLGYNTESWDDFSKKALEKGFKKEYLTQTGLSIEKKDGNLYDRYRGRVIFPIHSVSGKIVAFGGRILKKNNKTAKYVNSPESEIYHKSNELYGIYFARQAISKLDRCYLVEGYTDVLSMFQAGIENVVASSGTALTKNQIKLIHRYTNNVTILYDGDEAGIHASLRGINLLLEQDLNIKVLLLPNGEDPDSFSKKSNASDFQKYIKEHETDFIKFKTEILLKNAGNDPIKRADLIKDVAESISLINDDITRSVYIKECSEQLSFSEEILQREVNKNRKTVTKKRNDNSFKAKKEYIPSNNQNSFIPPPDEYDDVPQFIPDDLLDTNNYTPLPQEQAITNQNNIKKSSKENNIFYTFEKDLMRNIIRYGNKALCVDDDGNNVTVIQFIINDLDESEIKFKDEILDKMLSLARENMYNKNFDSTKFFVNHRDEKISITASNLIAEKYSLSKQFGGDEIEEKRLFEIIPRILIEFKYNINKEKIEKTERLLKEAQITKDSDKINNVLKRLMDLQEINRTLSSCLGNRIFS